MGGFFSFKSVTNVQHWCNLATRSYRNNFKFGYTIDKYFFSLKLRYNCNLGSSCNNKPCKKTCNNCIVVDTNSCNFIFEFFLIILQIRIILDLKLVHGIGILLGRPKNNTKLRQFLTKSLKLLKLNQKLL